MIKFSILMPRNPTMTHEQFVAYHRQQHAPLFMSIPAVKDNVRRYVQQHPVPLEGLDLPLVAVDGITELWFDDAQGIANVFTDPEYLRVELTDPPPPRRLGRCPAPPASGRAVDPLAAGPGAPSVARRAGAGTGSPEDGRAQDGRSAS